MLSLHNVVRAISCTFLLSLAILSSTRAENSPSMVEEKKTDQSDSKRVGQEADKKIQTGQLQGDRMIWGEVIRAEGDNLVIKEKNGKEIQLNVDQNTQKSERTIKRGDMIKVRLDEQNHVKSISSPDRRNDHMLDAEQTDVQPK
jgi:hypothetical protein